MNEVYLNENGHLFIDGHRIYSVKEVSVKTDWMGTNIVIQFKGSYKSDFVSEAKEHSIDECSKE